MNIYSKLQAARVQLQSKPIKPSGRNTFANYSYLDLTDFLPQINSICNEVGLCGVISFGEIATLTLVNTDNPEEKITFESPTSTAELKGCHPIQNLGAVQSYLRRYLWLTCFEVVEHDAIENTAKGDGKDGTFDYDPAIVSAIENAKTMDDLTPVWKGIDVGLRHEYKAMFSAAKARVGGASA